MEKDLEWKAERKRSFEFFEKELKWGRISPLRHAPFFPLRFMEQKRTGGKNKGRRHVDLSSPISLPRFREGVKIPGKRVFLDPQ